MRQWRVNAPGTIISGKFWRKGRGPAGRWATSDRWSQSGPGATTSLIVKQQHWKLMTHTWLPREIGLLFPTIRKSSHAHSSRRLAVVAAIPRGPRQVEGVGATQMKTQAASGRHHATRDERSLEFLRRRDWPYWRYLEREKHERLSVRIGRVDRMALIRVRKAGHRSDLHPICHMAVWQKRFVKPPGCQICRLSSQVEGRTF